MHTKGLVLGQSHNNMLNVFIFDLIISIKKIPKVLDIWIDSQNFLVRHNLDL